MRPRIPAIICTLALLMILSALAHADEAATVRIYVFMSPECSHCEPVHESNIRAVADKQGCKVEIKYFNIEGMADYKKLCDLERKYGASHESMPVVFIGKDSIGGEKEAGERIGPTIAKYAREGTAWPDEVAVESSAAPAPGKEQPAQQPSSGPVISFERIEADMGDLRAGQVVKATFPFRNTGAAKLTISALRTACGCFEIRTGAKELEPGKDSSVEVAFKTEGLKGGFAKSVMVDSDDPACPTVRLVIKARITPVVELSPERINFGDLPLSTTREETLMVTPVESKGFKLVDVKTEGTHVTVRKIEKPRDGRGAYRIKILLKAGDKPGRVYEKLSISVDSGGALTVPFMIYGNVQ